MGGAHRVSLPAAPDAEVEAAVGSRWVVLVLLAVSLLLVAIQVTVLTVVGPAVAGDLDAGRIERLLVADGYPLAWAGLLVTAGLVGDRTGRRRVFLFGYAIFALASLGAVFVDAPWQLIVCRIGLGAGAAAIVPASLAMVRQVFTDPRERAFAFAVWSVVLGLGLALGPMFGGWLLAVYDWHAVFVINVPLAMIAMLLGRWLLPDYRRLDRDRWDGPGMLVSAVALLGVGAAVGLTDGADPVSVAGVLVALLAGYVFLHRCLRLPAPLLDVRLLGGRPFGAAAATVLLGVFGMIGLLLSAGHWLHGGDEFGAVGAAVRLLPLPAGLVAGALLAPSLAARLPIRYPMAGGLLLTAIGMTVARSAGGYGRVAAALALVGVGVGVATAAAARILAGARRDEAGAAAALGELCYALGAALGMVALGGLGLTVVASVAALVSLAAAVLALVLVPASFRS